MITFGLASVPSLSIQENMQTLEKYALQAKTAGCTVLCFPECFLTGYLPKDVTTLSVSKTSSYCQQIQSMAVKLGIDLLVGFMEQENDNYYITEGIFLSSGHVDYYRKSHLGSREEAVFTPGDSLSVFSLSCGVKFGFQLCVETHFNDITQALSLKDASIIFAPHAVPRVSGNRQLIWNKYIPARSYDNRVYFACCNQWDPLRFGGGILVSSPDGEEVISSYEDREQLITFSLNKEDILSSPKEKYKHYFPLKRKPNLY